MLLRSTLPPRRGFPAHCWANCVNLKRIPTTKNYSGLRLVSKFNSCRFLRPDFFASCLSRIAHGGELLRGDIACHGQKNVDVCNKYVIGKFPRDLPANRHRRRAPSPLPLGTDLSLADEVGWIQFFLHVFSTCFVNKWPYPVLHGTKPRRYDFPIT